MIAIDKKPKNKPHSSRKTPFFPADPWADWQPKWRDVSTPHVFQEKHAPTETQTRRNIRQQNVEERYHRRIVDARLWDSMTSAQQDAACAIALAYETMGRGLGFNTSRWSLLPRAAQGHSTMGDAHARLINDYVDWTKFCHAAKVSHAMVIDVLVIGLSCAEVDRTRRMRKGNARANLFEGLRQYCKLRGWPMH